MNNNSISLSLIIAASMIFAGCVDSVETSHQSPPKKDVTRPAQPTLLPLVNPSFELSDRDLKGWSFSQHAGEPSYAVSIDTTDSTDGKNSYRIERRRVQVWGMINQWLPLENATGKSIKLDAMIKGENLGPNGFEVSLAFRKTNRKFIGKISSKAITGTSDWQRIEVTGTVPAHTAHLQIMAVLNDAGTAWLDDVQVSLTDVNKSSSE